MNVLMKIVMMMNISEKKKVKGDSHG